MLPIIEPTRKSLRRGTTLKGSAEVLAKEFGQYWLARPFLFDTHIIDSIAPSRSLYLERLVHSTRARGLGAIPVFRPGMESTARQRVLEMLLPSDLIGLRIQYRGQSSDDVVSMAHSLGLDPARTALIVDQGHVTDEVPPPGLVTLIAKATSWEDVVVLGGSFPRDLIGFTHDRHDLPRYEWRRFCELVAQLPPSRPVPLFGDYAMLHPVFEELDGPRPSVSIRYATEGYWIVLKGYQLNKDKGFGYDQYVGHAMYLVKDAAFGSTTYCSGDQFISDCARGAVSPGNFKTWVRTAFARHVSVTAVQIRDFMRSQVGRERNTD